MNTAERDTRLLELESEVLRLREIIVERNATLGQIAAQRDQLRLTLRGALEDIECLQAELRHAQKERR